MTRSDKVELFEQLRREYQFGAGTIVGVDRKFGLHRRMVRQAIANALPPDRKAPVRQAPQLAAVRDYIDAILAADKLAPRKQRHTAQRSYVRLRQDRADCLIAERTVRHCVRDWRQLMARAAYRCSCRRPTPWAARRRWIGTKQWSNSTGSAPKSSF